jgi:hypothetical protein
MLNTRTYLPTTIKITLQQQHTHTMRASCSSPCINMLFNNVCGHVGDYFGSMDFYAAHALNQHRFSK